jgi:hypothetical protein
MLEHVLNRFFATRDPGALGKKILTRRTSKSHRDALGALQLRQGATVRYSLRALLCGPGETTILTVIFRNNQ